MGTFTIRPTLTTAALIAALALLIGMQFNRARSQQVLSLKDSVPNITTNGTASTEVVPDIATITLGVESERPTAADAARENTRTAQAIVGEIKAQGIDAKDIKTLSVSLEPVYDEVRDPTGRVTKRTLRGYIAHNSLSVRIRDIGKAGALASQLMDKGANNLYGITFDYSQKEAKTDVLRDDAVRDAQRKANSYVSGLGLKLGRVLEIATEPAAPLPTRMQARALASPQPEAAAAIPIEPGAETLRANVRVTWELAQ
jgi:uncharacterized protein YggE